MALGKADLDFTEILWMVRYLLTATTGASFDI
jgi:hypothetical protein